ncbi:MAG: hypothetical protein JWP01_1548 [Myxococcales bacterium]|nr:hypothetical protein [Myxococcales bacterium]
MNPHAPRFENQRVTFPDVPFEDDVVVADRTLSHGVPSRDLLGGLPILRLIPQDVHSVMDYLNGVATGAGAVLAPEDSAAMAASMILGGSVIGVSLMTDYRLSLAKVIPIETHEAIDYAWGAMAIAAPFVLGYWKTSPTVGLMHVISGVGTILASMVTDYRSYRRR